MTVDVVNMAYDCGAVLHMNIPVTGDGCSAARAAIRAAEIQAKASRSAGTQTLVSGLLAFAAGLLAFIAATMESFRLKRRQKVISKSYSTKLHSLLFGVIKETQLLEIFFDSSIIVAKSEIFSENKWPSCGLNLRYYLAAHDALSLERWTDITNLSEKAIELSVVADIGINYVYEIFLSTKSLVEQQAAFLEVAGQDELAEMATARERIARLSLLGAEQVRGLRGILVKLNNIIRNEHPPTDGIFDDLIGIYTQEPSKPSG